jgi:hypothetical protein
MNRKASGFLQNIGTYQILQSYITKDHNHNAHCHEYLNIIEFMTHPHLQSEKHINICLGFSKLYIGENLVMF